MKTYENILQAIFSSTKRFENIQVEFKIVFKKAETKQIDSAK